MVFIHEKQALWAYWRAIQPFWTQDKDRYRLLDYSTRQLVRLLPLFGQPVNLPEGKAIGALYQTASRSVFNWIVPDESLFANPHYLIVGGTGSGRVRPPGREPHRHAAARGRAIIVDLGGSFEDFCAASGGVYVDYGVKSRRPSQREPALAPRPAPAPTQEMLRSLALWLASLARERGRASRATTSYSVLEEALRRAYYRDLQQPVFPSATCGRRSCATSAGRSSRTAALAVVRRRLAGQPLRRADADRPVRSRSRFRFEAGDE